MDNEPFKIWYLSEVLLPRMCCKIVQHSYEANDTATHRCSMWSIVIALNKSNVMHIHSANQSGSAGPKIGSHATWQALKGEAASSMQPMAQFVDGCTSTAPAISCRTAGNLGISTIRITLFLQACCSCRWRSAFISRCCWALNKSPYVPEWLRITELL